MNRAQVKTLTSFFLELAGSVVPASRVAAVQDDEPVEAAVARPAETVPRHSFDIPELYLSR
jgi:hypothetical protein